MIIIYIIVVHLKWKEKIMKLLGFTTYSFTPKGQTDKFSGFNLYVAESIPEEKGSGLITDKLSISSMKAEKLGLDESTLESVLGQEMKVSYDRWGKVQDISFV